MNPALSEGALIYACQRVTDFALVNKERGVDEKQDAIDIWLYGLGLDESLREVFTDWIDRFVGPGWDGAVMIGLAVGLFINQFNLEHPESD